MVTSTPPVRSWNARTNSSGSPGSLLAETGSVTASTGDNTYDVTTPVDLSAGTYWIVGNYATNLYVREASSGSVTTKYRAYTYTGSLPSSFSLTRPRLMSGPMANENRNQPRSIVLSREFYMRSNPPSVRTGLRSRGSDSRHRAEVPSLSTVKPVNLILRWLFGTMPARSLISIESPKANL